MPDDRGGYTDEVARARARKRIRRRSQARQVRRLIEQSSLGTPAAKAIAEEGRLRLRGEGTMSDAELLALIDKSLAD